MFSHSALLDCKKLSRVMAKKKCKKSDSLRKAQSIRAIKRVNVKKVRRPCTAQVVHFSCRDPSLQLSSGGFTAAAARPTRALLHVDVIVRRVFFRLSFFFLNQTSIVYS